MATRRLYYDDSFQKEFTARVVHCEVLPPDVNSGITGTVWGLILDRTAFYPRSGGQPNDLGKIGDANVLDVREEGDEIIHVVDRRPEDPDVNGCIFWPRRFDHMRTLRPAHGFVSSGRRGVHHRSARAGAVGRSSGRRRARGESDHF